METDRFRFLEFESSPPNPPDAAPPEPEAITASNPIQEPHLRVVEVIGELGHEVGQFICPKGLAIDPDGALYVADSGNGRVQRIALNGDVLHYDAFLEPHAVAVHPNGQCFFVSDLGDHRVYGFYTNGQRFQVLSGFFNPLDIVFDVEGFLWVADAGNARLARFHPLTGACIASWGREIGVVHPIALAFDSHGALYVADDQLGTILRYTAGSSPTAVLSSIHRISAHGQFALDLQQRLFLAEPNADRVTVFHSTGESLTVLQKLPGRLNALRAPVGLAFDPNYQTFYVSDTQNHRLLRVAVE